MTGSRREAARHPCAPARQPAQPRVASRAGLPFGAHDRESPAGETAGGIVINPAAFTHTSVAILDALNTFDGPVIEIHISNIHKREAFRHHSYVSGRADGVIAGFGTQGYTLAMRRIAALIDKGAN